MSEFEKVRIKELGKIVTGNTPVSTDETNYGGKYPFIKPTDMTIDQKYVFEYEETYSEKSYQRFKRSYIPKGATGVVTIGTVGEKMFQAHEDCFTNQSVNCIISDDKYFDKDYIFYLMKFNLLKVLGANPGTASGRHHVSKSNFSSIKIDVTKDLPTQKKIAKILSNYDDLIENNLKRIKLLEESARLTYEEWFLRFRIDGEKFEIDSETGLPFGWEMEKINKLASFINGYAFKGSDFTDIGNPVIKIKNIGNNTINIMNTNKVSIDTIRKVNDKFRLRNGDLLIAMTGATIGKLGFLPISKQSCYLNQRVGKLVSSNLYFIYSELSSDRGQQQISNFASGAAQPNISGEEILKVQCIIPTADLLAKFNTLSKHILDEILILNYQNQLLKEARDILLPRLMTGMIDVDELEVSV